MSERPAVMLKLWNCSSSGSHGATVLKVETIEQHYAQNLRGERRKEWEEFLGYGQVGDAFDLSREGHMHETVVMLGRRFGDDGRRG